MAFVDEDDVEVLRRDRLVVSDRKRLTQRGKSLMIATVLAGGIELGLTLSIE